MKTLRGNGIRSFAVFASLLGILTLAGCAAAGSSAHRFSLTKNNVAVMQSILDPVFATGDFQPFFDRLAKDVVLQVTPSDGMPASREMRGKRNVMAFLLNEGSVPGLRQDRLSVYFGGGERVIVLGAEILEVVKGGVIPRASEPAAVFDFREGRIIRVLVIQDASAIGDAYRRGGLSRANSRGEEPER